MDFFTQEVGGVHQEHSADAEHQQAEKSPLGNPWVTHFGTLLYQPLSKGTNRGPERAYLPSTSPGS